MGGFSRDSFSQEAFRHGPFLFSRCWWGEQPYCRRWTTWRCRRVRSRATCKCERAAAGSFLCLCSVLSCAFGRCLSILRRAFPVLILQLSNQQNRARTTSTVPGTPLKRTWTKRFPLEELWGSCSVGWVPKSEYAGNWHFHSLEPYTNCARTPSDAWAHPPITTHTPPQLSGWRFTTLNKRGGSVQNQMFYSVSLEHTRLIKGVKVHLLN